MAKLGIMGGTFDPIHNGHLIVAQEVAYKLGLAQVLFVPAADPPHKQHQVVAPVEQRVEMVRLALQDNPLFEVSLVDVERVGPSYTVDTLEILHQQYAGQTIEFYFIIGADAAADLLKWHRPQRLLELTKLAAVGRPGYILPLDRLQAAMPELENRLELVTAPLVEIAAHEIRERIYKGAPVKYLLPSSVEEYIQQHQLYI
jgi:nicotinate-nucleotide adenylyltransferase